MNSRYLHSVHPLKRIADVALLALTVLLFLRPAIAGDLNPPPGAIAPTQRTPIGASTTPGDADSLFKITLPGSYYLTGNITGVAGKSGIKIAASGVTLDLNGFNLLGVAGSLDGVSVSVAATDIAIVNGIVRSWGGDGVNASSADRSRLTQLLVAENGGDGLQVGSNSLVLALTSSANGGTGVRLAGVGNRLEGCHVVGNATGIFVPGSGNLIVKNSARENGVDFEIGPTNSYGPIIVAVCDLSLVGNADHPWANFSLTCTPSAELCDGLDNDCNPSTADGSADPLLGMACDGADSDLCKEGTLSCSGGVLVCSDMTGSTVDICNGSDDDCDPTSADGSEDPQVGIPCDGPDSDLCKEGVRLCVAGALTCSDNTGNNVEVCNGIDDDCDFIIDEDYQTLCGMPCTFCCSGTCVYVCDDPNNCGDCGLVCGSLCENGICW